MSFLDQREQRTRPTSARRARPPGRGTDRRTVRNRRAIALAGSAVVLLLLVLLIKGCRDSARQQGFKDYMRNAGAITDQSNQESRTLFSLLTNAGGRGPVELETAVNGIRTDAAQLVERARATEHPQELVGQQRSLIEALEFRRDGIAAVASQLPTALGDAGQSQASGRIAGAMQDFVASDVVFAQRFSGGLQGPLQKEGLLASFQLPRSRFLSDLTWLNAGSASGRIAALRAGGSSGPAAPGFHHVTIGVVTAKPGGQTLGAGTTAHVRATPNLSFDVAVMNQGENVERDVVVRLTVGGGGPPIQVEQRISSISAAQQRTVSIPLAATPPGNRPLTVSIQIPPVPGEKDLSNTKSSFPVIFG